MKRKSFWAGVAVLTAGLIFVTGGGAATTTTVTLTVNSTVDTSAPCAIVNHKSSGTCTLRGAILAAHAALTDNTLYIIKLAAKTYHLSQGTLDVDAESASTANIVQIVGKTATVGPRRHRRTIPASIIDGSGNVKPASVFRIDSPTQMYNVVITGGTGYAGDVGRGGGLFVGASLDLENSVVRNNTACTAWTGSNCTGSYAYGGGIYIPGLSSAAVTLYKTTVTHNKASYGGGIGYTAESANNDEDAVLLMSSHIDQNVACSSFSNGVCIGYGRGGGIWDDGETFTLDHSTVNGNVAGSRAYDTGDGGGIYTDDDALQLNHTVVNGNVAGDEGGGIYDDNHADLVNSTVSHNAAGYEGGGIAVEYLFTSKNSTVSSNTAGGTFECTIGGTTTCKSTVKTTTGTCTSLYPTATKCSYHDGQGGGIFSDYEYPQFIATTVTNNLVVSHTDDSTDCSSTSNGHGGQGGGVWTAWAMTAIQGSKFNANTAACGGGIFNGPSGDPAYTVNLANSTISGNKALRDGGGLWTTGPGSAILYGMKITGNHANRHTGGVWDDQLGSVLLGVGDTITTNTSAGSCKNIALPCK
jgi:CSLREA domain-containing protein